MLRQFYMNGQKWKVRFTHPENPVLVDRNFYGIFAMCLDQMEEDGFFKLTGLETFMDDLNVAAKPKKTPKKPTDHQKKATAK